MIITSSRLIYTKYKLENFDMYAQLMINEAVMLYITGKALTLEETKERFKRVMNDNASHPETGWFAVHVRETHELAGLAKLVDFGAGFAEAGYALFPEFWGKRYATEMLQTMIALAKRVPEFSRLIAVVSPENSASVRVLTKQGFVFHEALQKNGDWLHHYVAPMPL